MIKFWLKCFSWISEPAEDLGPDPHDNLIFDENFCGPFNVWIINIFLTLVARTSALSPNKNMSRTYFACHEVKFRHEIIGAKSRRPKITLHRNRAFVACFNCKFTIWIKFSVCPCEVDCIEGCSSCQNPICSCNVSK